MARADVLSEARTQGELAAARELRRLQVDLSHAVDIFDIITRQQIWLVFLPLDGALGTYLPGGILVTSKRSLRIQRLTAAHEYGHHMLGHSSSIDGETNLGDPKEIKEANEAAAQAFATDFLMPVRLVNSLWNRLALPKRIEYFHAYQLSLHMGTSYSATVLQLVAQEKITPYQGERFLKVQPKLIKQQVGKGAGPQNSWAEVWPIDQRRSGEQIDVGLEDEICLSLPESPSTGYLWGLPENVPDARDGESPLGYAASVLDVIRSEFEVVDQRLIAEGTGGQGNRYVTLRALNPGEAQLRIALRRPWLGTAPPLSEFRLDVRVAEKASGLLTAVQEALPPIAAE